MDEKICTKEQLIQTAAKYYREGWHERYMRLGQYLINNLAPIKTKAHDIYYEEDPERVLKLFTERYVKDDPLDTIH